MHRSYIGGSREVAALVALALLSVLSVTASADDDTPVRFQGRVLWIAGETLLVATDDSQSINVDLTQVPQDEYQLRPCRRDRNHPHRRKPRRGDIDRAGRTVELVCHPTSAGPRRLRRHRGGRVHVV